MTADTALRLAQYFGMSDDFWMNLQSACELDLARQQAARPSAYTEAYRYTNRGTALTRLGGLEMGTASEQTDHASRVDIEL